MHRLCFLLFLCWLSPAKADLIVYEHADCAPEFKLFPPSKATLKKIVDKEMHGSLWKFRSDFHGCYWDQYKNVKVPDGITILAIAQPQPISTHLCVLRGFSADIDIRTRQPKLHKKEFSWEFASSPCSAITADHTVAVTREIQKSNFPKVAKVLELLISLIHNGDESIKYDNDITRQQMKEVSMDELWMITGFQRNRTNSQYQELFVKFNPKSLRNQPNGIIGAKITLNDWKIIEIVINNTHEDDLL